MRLVEYNRRTTGLENTELWRAWPKNPGTTFSWKAGDSALHVAIIFARMILAATEHARLQSLGGYDLAPLPVAPEPDARFSSWRDATVSELREHTLPALPTWQMWEIHRDRGALLCKVASEWEQATGEDSAKVIEVDPLSIDAIVRLFQSAVAEFANVRAWLVVVEGHHIPSKLLPTITGRGVCFVVTLPPTTINAPLREAKSHEVTGVLLHGGEGSQAVEACNRLAAKAGAWLVANRMVADVPPGFSPSDIWWLSLHCKIGPSHQGSFENQAVWVHNPLVDSLQLLAGLKQRLTQDPLLGVVKSPSRSRKRKRRGAPSTAARDAEFLTEFDRGGYKSRAAFALAKKMQPSTMRHLLRRAEKARRAANSNRL